MVLNSSYVRNAEEMLAFEELQKALDRINNVPIFGKLKRASQKTYEDLIYDPNRKYKKLSTPPINIFADNFDPVKLDDPFDVISTDEDEFGPIHNLTKEARQKNETDCLPNLISICAEIHQAEQREGQEIFTTPPMTTGEEEDQKETKEKITFL